MGKVVVATSEEGRCLSCLFDWPSFGLAQQWLPWLQRVMRAWGGRSPHLPALSATALAHHVHTRYSLSAEAASKVIVAELQIHGIRMEFSRL
jgi:hypothetical protein